MDKLMQGEEDRTRFKRFFVAPNHMINIITEREPRMALTFEEGTEVRGVHFDIERQGFSILLWNLKWPAVPEGKVIPYV
jgi:hypothetical protein